MKYEGCGVCRTKELESERAATLPRSRSQVRSRLRSKASRDTLPPRETTRVTIAVPHRRTESAQTAREEYATQQSAFGPTGATGVTQQSSSTRGALQGALQKVVQGGRHDSLQGKATLSHSCLESTLGTQLQIPQIQQIQQIQQMQAKHTSCSAGMPTNRDSFASLLDSPLPLRYPR